MSFAQEAASKVRAQDEASEKAQLHRELGDHRNAKTSP